MKSILFSLVALISLSIISCSDADRQILEPQAIQSPINTDNPYDQFGQVGEKVGRPDSTKKDTVKKPQPTIFADLLIKLNLTPEQKTIVEKLLAEHKICVESCVQGLKNAERQILMNAKIEEEAIKTKLKNNEITKQQANLELRKLRESVNAQLKELPKEQVRKCVKSCDDTFIASLREILTTEQKITLEKWLVLREKRGTGPKQDTTNPKGRG